MYFTPPFFIFDDNILEFLPKNDAKVNFIYNALEKTNKTLTNYESALSILKGNPKAIWKQLFKDYIQMEINLNIRYLGFY